MSSETELSYRKSAIEGASPIGLVIALYDTVWGDLRRAAAAIRINDIEARCKELNHALLVLGQLETWVDVENGGELGHNLTSFYAYLRGKMLEASIKQSAPMLEELMELVLYVRSAWQQRDSFPVEAEAAPQEAETNLVSVPYSVTTERIAFSQSA